MNQKGSGTRFADPERFWSKVYLSRKVRILLDVDSTTALVLELLTGDKVDMDLLLDDLLKKEVRIFFVGRII